ncbi:hypothetical protein SODALDRAFT_375336 [Sodiomyces alkalinus F11]|uniref:BZIP domain-containing protein n=1 Tax=Sodiomyces alkalinus (strain CBS 110278 / VKM F-3762 / F11) TaxID=1314773 RepID=A0A3N2Q8Z6_SODAK|nr:hypothetical protein SODALDRAFT_375336 [Sodiomyces alkalinus F11]ROT43118.1 hypothetical protein SODALDRAFT_375336 [Sodiomyces alkalinus F11]
MPSKGSKQSDGSPTKSGQTKGKPKALKTDDWAEVTDPEMRRRIQNRIAQRKFREKARENKEKAERESQNKELAGQAYYTPSTTDLGPDQEESGLPWGGISMRHVVSRGHEYESRRSSKGDCVRDDMRMLSPYSTGAYAGNAYPQPPGYASSGAEEIFYEGESQYPYDFDQGNDPPQIQPQQNSYWK